VQVRQDYNFTNNDDNIGFRSSFEKHNRNINKKEKQQVAREV